MTQPFTLYMNILATLYIKYLVTYIKDKLNAKIPNSGKIASCRVIVVPTCYMTLALHYLYVTVRTSSMALHYMYVTVQTSSIVRV